MDSLWNAYVTWQEHTVMQNAELTEKSGRKNKKLLSFIKIGKEILLFSNIEIEENKFYGNKNLTSKIKVLVSDKITSGEKNYRYLLVTCIMIVKLSH